MFPPMTRAEKMTLMIRICLVVLTMAAGILAFGPFGGQEARIGLTDKEAHVLSTFVITCLAILALPKLRKWDVALLCLVGGGLVEVVQTMTGRDGDMADWLADAFGVALVMIPMTVQSMRRSVLNDTPRRRRGDQPFNKAHKTLTDLVTKD
ncbi:hypothetical protein AEAC466_07700 [Asticcacaulis sp. AC466]|uniref:hypothetical protein n=1 Tax=Asticcacaulis sp. AC466 TaxID=1282362 RepID=UPI0003C3C6DC|nr:hypothetical protein [Asticcacaulis sp. AC466]ESQ84932.1 hypothetical protein AEAC466_07700 [Asticcacaulis sp. AC466]